jgi:AGCS family alanine or glycine:cation symporter
MISWCYYGERGWIYLNEQVGLDGLKNLFVFRIIFLVFVVFGSINSLSDVIDFSDLMILSMAFPNILGSIFLVGKVKEKLNDYWSRYQSGAF